MSPELDEKLCLKYPKIFENRSATIYESCMAWGFSCGDGWYELIDTLCGLLQWYTDQNKRPQVIATQVKQKFGTLRFYVQSATEEQYGMISMAEQFSMKICEECGSSKGAKIRNGAWVQSLCDDCFGSLK